MNNVQSLENINFMSNNLYVQNSFQEMQSIVRGSKPGSYAFNLKKLQCNKKQQVFLKCFKISFHLCNFRKRKLCQSRKYVNLRFQFSPLLLRDLCAPLKLSG